MDSMSLFTNALNAGTKWYDSLISVFTGGLVTFIKNSQQHQLINNLQYFFNNIIIPIINISTTMNQKQ
jgi:hypothetical protein